MKSVAFPFRSDRTAAKFAASRRRARRRGALLSVELVLVLPILVMMTIAVVQFGLLFANLQQVSLASRVGVGVAAESPNLTGTMDGDPVPLEVREAVSQQLSSSGIDWCRIRLEHNVDGPTEVLVSEQNGGCDCGPQMTLPDAPYDDEQYVRITVCVPLTELTPNALTYFGYSIIGPDKVVGFTQVRRVEP
jgi:Flp pilus assembly protein TadG